MENQKFRQHIFLVALGVVLYVSLQNIAAIWDFLLKVFTVFQPIFLAFCMAYVLNLPLRFYEEKLFSRLIPKVKQAFWSKTLKKIKRPVSLFLACFSFFAFLIGVSVIAIPQIIEALTKIITSLPSTYERFYQSALSLAQTNDDIKNIIHFAAPRLERFFNENFNALAVVSTLGKGLSVAGEASTTMIQYSLSFVLAIYMLASKDLLLRQLQRICRALFKEKITQTYILPFFVLLDQNFSSYITGQVIDAILLGIMVMLGMMLFSIPYVLLVGTCMILFALVPFVGAYLSLLLGTFIIFTEDPIKALWFILIVIVAQQIDNHFVYPYVVGKSVSLPSVWVLIALMVGGSLFGVSGMLISVPVCAVLYTLSRMYIRSSIYEELESKRKNGLLHRVSEGLGLEQKQAENRSKENEQEKA